MLAPGVVAISSKKRGGKTRYYIRWVDPQTGREVWRAAGTTLSAAKSKARRRQADLAVGLSDDLKSVTWADFVAEHVALLPGRENSYAAQLILQDFGRVCKPATPDSVSYAMVEGYVKTLREKSCSVATINKKLRYLRAALNKAIKRGYCRTNPVAGWEWERENRKTIRVLSTSEQSRLLEACPTDQWRTFVALALKTGCRKGELLALTWDRVNFEQATILLTHTKGKSDRVLPLVPSLVVMLRKLQAETIRFGQPFPWAPRTTSIEFKKIVRRSGIQPCTIHDLRRTFCTDLARAGVNQLVIQRLAGHADAATTAKYYQVVQDDTLRGAILRLDQQTPGPKEDTA